MWTGAGSGQGSGNTGSRRAIEVVPADNVLGICTHGESIIWVKNTSDACLNAIGGYVGSGVYYEPQIVRDEEEGSAALVVGLNYGPSSDEVQ